MVRTEPLSIEALIIAKLNGCREGVKLKASNTRARSKHPRALYENVARVRYLLLARFLIWNVFCMTSKVRTMSKIMPVLYAATVGEFFCGAVFFVSST